MVQTEDGGCAIALDPQKLRSLADEKYKLAHELGHGPDGPAFYQCLTPLDERGRCEVRADRWAIRHLLPFEALQEAIASGITDQQSLAEYFDLPPSLLTRPSPTIQDPAADTFPRSFRNLESSHLFDSFVPFLIVVFYF